MVLTRLHASFHRFYMKSMKFYMKKMEKVSFFFLIASMALAHGFKTQKCNQDLLEVKTMGMMKCLQARWDEVEHLFKPNNMQTLEDNPLGCDFIDKNIACWNEHLGSCFIDDFRKDMATLLDASYENQAYVACHRNGVRRTNQLTLVQKRLAQKYAQYQFQPEKLNEIIQLDNQCSYFTFVRDFQEEWECFTSEGKSKIKDLYSTLYPRYSSGSQGNDVVLPVCDVLAFGLDCFHLRECLNDQEGKFLANLIVTFYKVYHIL